MWLLGGDYLALGFAELGKNNYELCDHHHHMQEYHLNHFLQSHKDKIRSKILIFHFFMCVARYFLPDFSKLRLIDSFVPLNG